MVLAEQTRSRAHLFQASKTISGGEMVVVRDDITCRVTGVVIVQHAGATVKPEPFGDQERTTEGVLRTNSGDYRSD